MATKATLTEKFFGPSCETELENFGSLVESLCLPRENKNVASLAVKLTLMYSYDYMRPAIYVHLKLPNRLEMENAFEMPTKCKIRLHCKHVQLFNLKFPSFLS